MTRALLTQGRSPCPAQDSVPTPWADTQSEQLMAAQPVASSSVGPLGPLFQITLPSPSPLLPGVITDSQNTELRLLGVES